MLPDFSFDVAAVMTCEIGNVEPVAASLRNYAAAIFVECPDAIRVNRRDFEKATEFHRYALLRREGYSDDIAALYANNDTTSLCARMLARAVDFMMHGRLTD